MKYLVVLPDVNYFMWQMLVQINNFKNFGLDNDLIYVIGRTSNKGNDLLYRLGELNCKCDFHIYDDRRINPSYASSLRPYLLKTFFKEHTGLYNNQEFFYLDPDVVLTKKLKVDDLLKNNNWYVSDTCSYIDSAYIKSKSEVLFKEMCGIVGIDHKIVEANDKNAGGAQYLMKNLTAEYWEKVERDSEELYKHMINTSSIYNPEHPIQAWTADMWAVLWNAWFFGHKTKIIKRLDFCWATDSINRWDETAIYHNAGATSDRKDLFVKTDFQVSPFNKDLSYVSDTNCSFNYVKEIKDTEKNFKEFLF
jgi:hypothetical protein